MGKGGEGRREEGGEGRGEEGKRERGRGNLCRNSIRTDIELVSEQHSVCFH